MNQDFVRLIERLTKKTSLSEEMLEALVRQAGVDSCYSRKLDNDRVSLQDTLEHYTPTNADDCHAIGNIFARGGKFKYNLYFKGLSHYFYINLNDAYPRDSLLWHFKAAKLGNATSLFIVGLYLVFGIGTDSDVDKGGACIKEAAKQGCQEAKDYVMFPIFPN